MNHSNFIEFDKNPVIEFIKGTEFAVIITNIVRAEMDNTLTGAIEDKIRPLSKKLEEVENEVKLLRYMNAKLVKKLRECDSAVDDSEICSLLSEVNIHTDSDEETEQDTGERVLGTVRWFNAKAGYGFIEVNDTKQEVFVHKSAISKKNPNKLGRSLQDGEIVEFGIKASEKGREAVKVTGPNKQPVKGSIHDPEKKPTKDIPRRYLKFHKGKGSQYSSNQSINLGSFSRCSSRLGGLNTGSRTSSQQSLNIAGQDGKGAKRGNRRGSNKYTGNQRSTAHDASEDNGPSYQPTNSYPDTYVYSYQTGPYGYPYPPNTNTGPYYQNNYMRN